MSNEVLQQLAEMHKRMFEISGAALLEELDAKISDLHLLLTVQKGFDEISGLIRNERPLPIRKMGFNLKILLEEKNRLRWSRLLELDFASFIFCTFCHQALASLAEKRFNAVVDNVERYLQAQALPSGWVMSDKIRKAVTNVPKQAHTAVFWEKYRKTELEHYRVELERSNIKDFPDSEGQPHVQLAPDSARAEETPRDHCRVEVSVLETGSALAPGDMMESKRNRSKQDSVLEPGLGEPSPKRSRLELQHIPGSAVSLGNDVYFPFCVAKPERIQRLPQFFLNGMEMSRSWQENRGNFARAKCLSLHIPRIANQDAIFSIKLDYNSGWELLDMLGMGDSAIP